MTTPTIQANLQVLHSNDGVVDLYKLDASAFGGPVYSFSPQCYSNGAALVWGGQTYSTIPIGIDSLEQKTSSSSLPQPTLIISNVGGPILAQVIAYGDLTGATLTHWKTKVSYLDGQANPDTTQFVGPQVWRVFQKLIQTNQQIQWALASPLDLPGMFLPVRQVLKDANINPPDGVYFPGVTPYRLQ
jgi:lambda family phage minor tail protein L